MKFRVEFANLILEVFDHFLKGFHLELVGHNLVTLVLGDDIYPLALNMDILF